MSISDPQFKVHKDNVEAEAYRRFGDKVIVDIDDVSGDVRLIPAKFHNKFESTSKQPGIDVPIGSNIKEKLDEFASTLTDDKSDTFVANSELDILNELDALSKQFKKPLKSTKRFG